MTRLFKLLLLLILLGGCGSTIDTIDKPGVKLAKAAPAPQPFTRGLPQPAPGDSETALMYNLLVAEIAGTRNLAGVAAAHYIAAIEQHPDAVMAQRATQIALYAQDYSLAERAAKVWATQQPTRVEPRQVLAAVYIQQGNRAAAREHLLALLELRDLSSSKEYLTLAKFFATKQDQQAMLTVLEEIAAARPEDSEAQFAAAILAVRFNDYTKALNYTDAAAELRPDWADAVILHAQVLALNDQPDAGVELLKTFSAKYPEQPQAAYALARMLLDANRPSAAREQFNHIHQTDPDNAEALFALGLLNMQLGDLPAAQTHLLALEKKGFQENRVHYYLGKLAERLQQPAQAIRWYSTISDKDYRVDAASRIAYLKAYEGDIDAALALLEQTETTSDNEKIQLAVVNSDILVHAERYDDAIAVASAALAQFPDDVDLLFSRSAALERAGQFDAMEQDVRAILAIHPDNAHALNALGYSFADRNIRLAEARKLLTQALTLEPDNAYILDSMGWVEYRQGHYDKALVLLRQALAAMPGGEVYAHLATVLVATGADQQARQLLQKGLTEIPDSPDIQAALRSLDQVSENR